ncbi:unnamed protein product [Absidia cylindrospora]
MDMFARGKSKPKRRPEQSTTMISTPIPQQSLSDGAHSSVNQAPYGHLYVHTNSDNTSAPSAHRNGYLSETDEDSIRSYQTSTTYALANTNETSMVPAHLGEAEIQNLFEKMLTRRGIQDPTARNAMTGFTMEKKRLMVTQDIQAESAVASNHPTSSASARRASDKNKEMENSPEYFVKKLSEKVISGKVIAHLAVGLRTMPLSWIRQFIAMRGLQLITESLTNLNSIKHKRDLEIHIEGDLLKCFKALLNNRVGAKEAIKHPPCIQQIVNCIVSPSITARRLVCEVLVFLCYFQVPSGQEMVLKALDQLRDTARGFGRFDLWLKELDTSLGGRGRMGSLVGASDDFKQLASNGNAADGQLAEYALYNMIFVNAIVNVVDDTEVRIHLRNQLNASGLERVMERMSELGSEHVDRQIQEFKSWAENDHDEMMEIYHEKVLRNMNDPRDVFECILSSVEGSRGYDFFLSCLQHMLLIQEEHGLKSRYFQIIDNLITQVVLDHKGLVDDFSVSYGTSVRHLVDKFADQDQLQATLDEILVLQAMYDGVVKERDDIKTQLSENGGSADVAQVHQLKEKTASLEDLLRMSRHTISTLQGKLRTLQEDYDQDLKKAQSQLEVFYKAVDDVDENDGKDEIVLQRKDLAKAIGRIKAQESLEGRQIGDVDTSNNTKHDTISHKSMAIGLSDEFKNQLAMQFGSSSGLNNFVVPGALPLMGSAQRRPKPFRHHHHDNSLARSDSLKSFEFTSSPAENVLDTSAPTTGNDIELPDSPTSASTTSSHSSTPSSVAHHISVRTSSISTETEFINTNTNTNISTTTSTSSRTQSISAKPNSNEQAPRLTSMPPSPTIDYSSASSSLLHSIQESSTSVPIPPPPPPPPPPLPVSSPDYLNGPSSFATDIKKQVINKEIRKSTISASLFTDTSHNENTSIPPPPPSVAAPPSNLTTRKMMKHLPNVKTRALQWQKINMHQIKSTVWESSDDIEQGWEKRMDSEGVFDLMEELFAQKVIATPKKRTQQKKQEINIIDSRKAYNINIAILAKCKHISLPEIKQNILTVDEGFCSETLLRNLQLNAPTPEEMGKLSVFLKTASEDDIKNLSKPDAFCATIMSINRFKERIDCMLFKVTFSERIAQLSQNMSNVMEASTSLKESQAFKDFLNIILLVGNFLNGTNFQGGAFGIRIDSINKLVDTKASNNDSTLLHFLISTMESKFGNTSNQVLEDLKLCGEACRVTIQDLVKDYNELRTGLQQITYELDRYNGLDYVTLDDDKFELVMSSFRDMAVEKFDQLEVRYTSMDVAYKDVVSYFGENPDDMKPDEFFSIFKTFTSSWERAKSDLEGIRKKQAQAEKARQYEEQRQQRIKQAKSSTHVIEAVSENLEDKHIMDNLLERLRAGEMATATKQRGRRNTIRDRRRTKTESVVIKAEDLLKHMQNEMETPPPTQPKSRNGSKRLASSQRMERMSSLKEETVNT